MKTTAVPLLIATLLACASAGQSGPTRQRNMISAEEVAELHVSTAYEVIQTLRPEFLRSRGTSSIRSPNPETAVVYVDGVRVGGIETLRSLSRDVIEEIRYLNGSDATTLYGTGHGGGVIQITTRRG